MRDGDEWILDGQKVWTTWAHLSEFAICLARTDPDVPKRRGITYFLVDLRTPGVTVRPLRHIGGEVDFNEVFLDDVRVPDFHRIGAEGDGWRVAGATLAGERQMVVGRGVGRGRPHRRLERATRSSSGRRALGRLDDPASCATGSWPLYSEERIRDWTNQRVRGDGAGGRHARSGGIDRQGAPGRARTSGSSCSPPTCSVPTRSPGSRPPAPTSTRGPRAMPFEVTGMLRSRANTIEGGTTEVNKNILGEKVLGLPREPDPYREAPWDEVPRS